MVCGYSEYNIVTFTEKLHSLWPEGCDPKVGLKISKKTDTRVKESKTVTKFSYLIYRYRLVKLVHG